jgi:antitoxin component YwqK of YwqJK toxin-antitoxin module
LHGFNKEFGSNGKLSMVCTCINGIVHGIVRTWWPDGTLNDEETYENGERIFLKNKITLRK